MTDRKRPMRIWIVATGEPWPTDSGKARLLRGGILAKYCAAAGDEVVWWNTTFDHRRREDRFHDDVVHQDPAGIEIRGLHASTGYKRSVSPARILNHMQVGAAFRRQVESLARPDVILACMPLVELAHEAVRFGRKHDIPVVVDLRDFWPDVWLEPVPALLRPLAKAAMIPWNRMLADALQGATAISGITDSFLEWGLKRAGRSRQPADFWAPLAYDSDRATPSELRAADAFWNEQGIGDDGLFVACFFGTLANRTGIELLVEAARLIPTERRDRMRIVIAGQGDAEPFLRAQAADLEHVVMPGWVDLPKIAALKARSSVGVIPYPNTPDFVASIPNKVPEYLAGGLAVVSTLQGEVEAMLEQYDAGLSVAPRTPQAIADALIALMDDPRRLAQLRQGAQAASGRFASEQVYGAFRSRLASLVKPDQSTV